MTQAERRRVLILEVVNRGGDHLIYCLTLFSRREIYPFNQPVRLANPVFIGTRSCPQFPEPLRHALERARTKPCAARNDR